MLPTISVVVPAYNAAEYLRDCLSSIRAQSFADFEVLVVNDGSSDDTPHIAVGFADSDPRFKLVSIPNGGVSKARNAGITEASGQFITFVDADDLLHPHALKAMVETTLKYGSDVCVTGFRRFKDKTFFSEDRDPDVAVRQMDYPEAMRLALYQKIILNNPWGALIRRELFADGRKFREGIRYEDLDAFYHFYENARSILYLPFPYYLYRDNPSSFINTWSEARLDVLDVTDRMLAFFEKGYPALIPAASDRRFSAHFNMYLLMKRHKAANPEALERCRRVIREGRRRALSDPSVRLKNKVGALLSYLFMP